MILLSLGLEGKAPPGQLSPGEGQDRVSPSPVSSPPQWRQWQTNVKPQLWKTQQAEARSAQEWSDVCVAQQLPLNMAKKGSPHFGEVYFMA